MSDPDLPRTKQLPIRAYLLLWLLAFLPRLALSLVFFQHAITLDDMYQYDMLARSIIQGRGYRWYSAEDFEPLETYYDQFLDVDQLKFPEKGIKTAHRGPGYPLFLSGVYSLVPEQGRFGWTRVIQAAMTAGLAPLTAFIAAASGIKKRTAVLSGAAMGLYPILLFYPVALASENLFILTLTGGFVSLLQFDKRGKWTYLFLSSLFLALSIMTRSAAFLFLLFSAVWLMSGRRKNYAQAALFLAVTLALCLPWAVRNSRLMGKPTFLETSLGYNLYISYHPEGNGGFKSEIAIRPLKYVEDQAREAYTMKKASQFIRQNPGDAVVRIFRKMAFFFGLEDREIIYLYSNGFFGVVSQPWRLFLYLALVLPWMATLLFSPLGAVLHPDRRAVQLTLGLLVTYAGPHFLIISEPRFHLALVPSMLPFAALGWTRRKAIFNQFSSSGHRKRTLIILGLIWTALLLLLVWHISLHWDTLLNVMGPDGHNLHLTY